MKALMNQGKIMQPLELHDPDWQLIQQMAAGDTSALDRLYVQHGPAVLSFLIGRLNDRQLAEEILQDVMLSAWKSAPGFRLESKVRTWLLVIARNRAINARRKYAPMLVDLETNNELQSPDTGPMERVERSAQKSAVREALRLLPETYREVLILVFYHQLSGPEIAEVLDISQGTVKSRLHRAKEMLRRVLLKEGEF